MLLRILVQGAIKVLDGGGRGSDSSGQWRRVSDLSPDHQQVAARLSLGIPLSPTHSASRAEPAG